MQSVSFHTVVFPTSQIDSNWTQRQPVQVSTTASTFQTYLFWLVVVGRLENYAQKLQWFNQKSPFF